MRFTNHKQNQIINLIPFVRETIETKRREEKKIEPINK